LSFGMVKKIAYTIPTKVMFIRNIGMLSELKLNWCGGGYPGVNKESILEER